MKREKERKSKRDKNGGRTDFPSSGTGRTQLHRCNCSPHRSFASRVRGLVVSHRSSFIFAEKSYTRDERTEGERFSDSSCVVLRVNNGEENYNWNTLDE